MIADNSTLRHNNFFHAYLIISHDDEALDQEIDKIVLENNCDKVDISVIEPSGESGKAGEISIASIRSLLHDISLTPNGKIRIGIIKQADRLNRSSANILLKNLEEPPPNVIFILTAKRANIIPTIQSRCRTVRINSMTKYENDISCKDLASEPLYKVLKKIEEIIKANQTEVLLDSLIREIEAELQNNFTKKSAKLLEEALQSKKMIEGNANKRLVLENLILSLRKYYE
jgi:DNA polymerase III delta prime subunit